jgi:sulfite exporter TauE/SafE
LHPVADLQAAIPNPGIASVLFGVLVASLAGSMHCVGMCGGLMLSATGVKTTHQVAYHLARGVMYTSAGAIVGALGQRLWVDTALEPIQLFFSVLLGVFLIILSIHILVKGEAPRFAAWRWVERPFRWASQGQPTWLRAGVIGALTVFLPCGWLFGFLMMALASGQAWLGGLMMAVFWAGTVPLLATSRLLFQMLLKRFSFSVQVTQRWIAVGMLALGFVSIYEHLRPWFQVGPTPAVIHCEPGGKSP